jgi:threonine synthase
MIEAVRAWASDEGIFAAPEGAACLVAYDKLRESGFLRTSDKVVLFNTGSGLKYIDVIAKASGMGTRVLPASRNIGGIIQPN